VGDTNSTNCVTSKAPSFKVQVHGRYSINLVFLPIRHLNDQLRQLLDAEQQELLRTYFITSATKQRKYSALLSKEAKSKDLHFDGQITMQIALKQMTELAN
jgi:hypothetical protein